MMKKEKVDNKQRPLHNPVNPQLTEPRPPGLKAKNRPKVEVPPEPNMRPEQHQESEADSQDGRG